MIKIKYCKKCKKAYNIATNYELCPKCRKEVENGKDRYK
jgi:RNA polymerase subunit RPABC4/transcription elongation factor Spt4